jgi:UDP-glucose 6-dehydrogenase
MVSKESIFRDIRLYWKGSFLKSQNRIKILNKIPNFEEIDAGVVITEWEMFKTFDFKLSKVFDGRNILNINKTIALGK